MRKGDIRPFPRGVPERLKRDGLWRDETLADLLARHTAKQPNKTAILSGPDRLTYSELDRRMRSLASGLKGLGVRAGDVVAVQLPNSIEFVVAYLAINRIGAVMQTLHLPYRIAEIENLTEHSQAKALICLQKYRDYPIGEQALKIVEKSKTLKQVVVVAGEAPGALRFGDVANAAGRDLGPVPRADEPSLVLYTSGTTASPKGVLTDHRVFLSNARLSAIELGITASDIVLNAAPFTHLYGLFSLHLGLYVGGIASLLPAFVPQEFAQAVVKTHATVLFTAPAHCSALLRAKLLEPTAFQSVRTLVISGSICPPDIADGVAAQLKNGKVLQLWGMTEIQAGAYTRPGDPPEIRHRTIGRASPGNELRIVGDDGKPAAAGTEGELQIRGASVASGYFANDEANKAAFAEGGWFRSGDLGKLDAQGNLTITGRLKDVINRGGVKFNPADVEAAIAKMAGVQACAIVPYKDAVLGEKACAFVQLGTNVKMTLDVILQHLEHAGIAKNKWPERLEIVGQMPLTPTNKVIKSALKITTG
ncbi:MAG: acyl--CoA ligase [Alphaproteobacteria bacterium]|nr:acyl--CoA ligase [Alphaproteobacteria bacterium]